MVRIVVWDPSGRYPEGALLEGPNLLALEATRGTVLLPADQDLCLGPDACGGYFRRGWGPGVRWGLAGAGATRGCPMLLRAVPERGWVHWAARAVPANPRALDEVRGRIHLAANTAQLGGTAVGLQPVSEPLALEALGPPDQWGGWVLRGSSRLGMVAEGMLGLSLYGAARGVAVTWSAVTLSRQET